jgi:hypothetical protein
MNKHTPGPWLIDYSNADDYRGGQWYSAGPARVHFPYRCAPEEQTQACSDAHLIAAAPDLLEALDELANGYAGNRYDVGLVQRLNKARAAIASALGEQS